MMQRQRLRLVLLPAVLFALAACATPPPPPAAMPELRYDHADGLRLDAGSLEVISEYQAPFRSPNIEHLMPTSPERAAMDWARDRLSVTGQGELTARFVVRDASVTEEELGVRRGFMGLFHAEQSHRYEARLEAVVELVDERRRQQAEAYVRVSRSRTVPEGITLNEREQVWFELVEAMMEEFDREMEATVRRYMGPHMM